MTGEFGLPIHASKLAAAAACFLTLVVQLSAFAQENRGGILINDLDLLHGPKPVIKGVKLQKVAPRQTAIWMAENDAIEVDLAEIIEPEELEKYEVVLSRSLSTRYFNQYLDLMMHRANAELRFFHQVVRLKRSEFEALEPQVRLEAKRCLLRYCQTLAIRRQERAAGWNRSSTPVNLETTTIASLISAWATKSLSKDQADRYRDEVKKRQDFRREAALELMTVKLDEHFVFSKPQRETVQKLLNDHWDDRWTDLTRVAVISGIGAIPNLPWEQIGQTLNGDQAIIFASIRQSRAKSNPIATVKAKAADSILDELEFAPEIKGCNDE